MKAFLTLLATLVVALFSVGAATASTPYYFDYETQRFVQGERSANAAARSSPIKRQVVDYESTLPVGTIVVETSERRLYLVLEDGKALQYGIGVGRDGFRWAGTHTITRKAEWPGWTPPPAMRKREPHLPAFMPGGPENPLGARALYIGSTLYRLHGTAEPWTIGQAVSSGCIRLTNDDIIDLYERTRVGARVIVRH